MRKFIDDNIATHLQSFPDQQKKQTVIGDMVYALKAFVKQQSASMNKQLANKTRQLFILSSDIECLKQKNSQLQTIIAKLKQQKLALDQQKSKQRIRYESELLTKNEQYTQLKKYYEDIVAKAKDDYQKLQQNHCEKIKQLKRQFNIKLNDTVDLERKNKQEEFEIITKQNQEQKMHILQQSAKQKSAVIKKYQEKIFKIKEQNEKNHKQLLQKINKQTQQFKILKGSLQYKIAILSNENAKLQGQLKIEIKQHQKYQSLYNKIKQNHDNFRATVEDSQKQLVSTLTITHNKLVQEERTHKQDVRSLKKQLQETILNKDKHFIDTVEVMNTQHRIIVESLTNQFVQQKQLAINDLEIKRYEQNFQNVKKYEQLQHRYKQLQIDYDRVKQIYEQKIQKMTIQHSDFIQNLDSRLNYQMKIQNQCANRDIKELVQKYQLQINSLKRQQKVQLQQLAKKCMEEKIVALNKLTSQYQSMLNDLRTNQQVQIKQKIIEFDRKAKGYQKKITQAQKRRSELKLAGQRIKMQMQMKIDSMLDANRQLEQQLYNFEDRLQDVQNDKSRLISEYELKIVLVNNQMQHIKDQYDIREEEMKEILQSKLQARNRQISRLTDKIKKQTVELVKRHDQKIKFMEKQYNQLKKVVAQRASLPEDIEALKIYHQAFLQKQQELKLQKRKNQQFKRQLLAKEAIDKVFAQKAFQSRTLLKDVKISSYTSQQL